MHIFFDLDGTLTDSHPGIIRCVNHALGELGHAAVPAARLRGMIGSPPTRIFADGPALRRRGDARSGGCRVPRALRRGRDFRECTLSGCRRSARRLVPVRTHPADRDAKPAVSARRVVAHFGIDGFFRALHGPELSARDCDKAALVGVALRVAGGDPRHAVMVGDRAVDVLAARQHAVSVVGAAWGYGSPEELESVGPDYVADTVPALVRWLQRAG